MREPRGLWAEIDFHDAAQTQEIGARGLSPRRRRGGWWVPVDRSWTAEDARRHRMRTLPGRELWSRRGPVPVPSPRDSGANSRGLPQDRGPFYTLSEAAPILHLSLHRIRQLIREGRFEAYRPSVRWHLTQASVHEYGERHPRLPVERAPFASVQEVARRWGCTAAYVRQLCERGALEAYRDRGRGPWYVPESVASLAPAAAAH